VGFHNMNAELTLLDCPKRFDERRHVENIAQAFPVCLEKKRERRISRGDAEEIVRTLTELP